MGKGGRQDAAKTIKKTLRLTPEQLAEKSNKASKRLQCYQGAVPDFEVFGHTEKDVLMQVPPTVDNNDRHVAAAAIVLLNYSKQFGGSDRIFIVTDNLRHLAVDDMMSLGIDVISPGAFIDLLLRADSQRVETALRKSISDLAHPPYTKEMLLSSLEVHGSKATVTHFSAAWGIKLPHPGATS